MAQPRVRARPRSQTVLPWAIPVLVLFVGVALSHKHLADLIGLLIALPIFLALVRRPGVALIILVIALPLEPIGFPLLYSAHVPAALLRPLSSYKELLGLAVLVAGLLELRRTGRKLDRIDVLLLVYVGVVTLYLAVPHLFASGAPTEWSTRLLAWRTDAGYVLIFFGARHAPLGARVKEHFTRAVLAIGALMGAVGIFERLDVHGWVHFVGSTAHVPLYEVNVLGETGTQVVSNLGYIYNTNPLRVSSLLLSPFDMSDYLVVAIAIAAVRISSARRDWLNYVVLGLGLASIFFSRSRSDGVAAVIVLVLIALPSARSPLEGRLRLIGVLLVAAALIVPVLGGTRFVGAQGGSSSASGHVVELQDGLRVLEYYPLGLGLGDQPDTATRFTASTKQVNPAYISDNLALQVGDELGFQALLPWLAMMGCILWEFWRRGRRDAFAAALGFAFLGVVIAGLYHQVFLTFPVPWTLWGGAGLALNRTGLYPDRTLTEAAIPQRVAPGVP